MTNDEKLHIKQIQAALEAIRIHYHNAIHEVSFSAGRIRFPGVVDLSQRPDLLLKIDQVLEKLNVKIYSTLINSISESWNLSNLKNNTLVDKRLAEKLPADAAPAIFYDANVAALKTFIQRKQQGLKLSEKVWDNTKKYKNELIKGLSLGISEGKSAGKMASDLKRYLKEPEKLFRRVENSKGKLVLSKAAKDFHPGQGVYRSSFGNALRLTASETNMAYRTADFTRWNKLPFVVGIEIHLSKSHPTADICNHLAGKYPKDFLFRGFHPRCLCYSTAIQITAEEYNEFEKAILEGKQIDIDSVNKVGDVPGGFTKWMNENKKRIKGWKSKPYFLSDNIKFAVKALRKEKSI